jgi:hypothetical protein
LAVFLTNWLYISFFHHISTFFVFYSNIYCTYIPEKRKLSGDRGWLVSLAFSVIGRWIKEWQKKIPPIKWASSIISQNILLGCIFHDIKRQRDQPTPVPRQLTLFWNICTVNIWVKDKKSTNVMKKWYVQSISEKHF